ncbi:TolC family outer membrane protein [Luteimonas sp. SDU101]|uniref:TolC family outer membrane protein n=1 Tax=unclassified Luteimonas TaxID=2629088 RepID=UPI003EBE9935
MAAGAGSAAAPVHQAEQQEPAQAWLSSSAVLDLNQAVAIAVEWHPSVRNAASYLLESVEAIDAARAGYYPQVRAGLASDYRNRDVPGYDSRRVHTFTVSVSQMLYDFGKVSSQVDRARAGREAAQARVLLAVDELARDTAHAWIEVRRYEQLLQLAQAQREGVSAIADLARERRAKGASALSDELQARAREEAAQANQLDIASQLERWRLQLRQLTGLSTLPATGGDADAVLSGACDVSAAASGPEVPAVLVAQADLRATRAELDNARAQSRPTISVDGSVSRGLDADSRMGHSHDSAIGLSVSAPLYQGGGHQARRRAAGHVLSAAEAALDHARLQASQGLTDAQSRARGHAGRNAVLGERAGSIEHTRDLYRQQYLDLGTRSLLDLLNAEQEFHGARVERAHNSHDLLRMQVDCLAGSGRLRPAFGLERRAFAGVELAP